MPVYIYRTESLDPNGFRLETAKQVQLPAMAEEQQIRVLTVMVLLFYSERIFVARISNPHSSLGPPMSRSLRVASINASAQQSSSAQPYSTHQNPPSPHYSQYLTMAESEDQALEEVPNPLFSFFSLPLPPLPLPSSPVPLPPPPISPPSSFSSPSRLPPLSLFPLLFPLPPFPTLPSHQPNQTEQPQRLKSALWYSIGRIVDEETLKLGVNATPQFIGALTELVWGQIGECDLAFFPAWFTSFHPFLFRFSLAA